MIFVFLCSRRSSREEILVAGSRITFQSGSCPRSRCLCGSDWKWRRCCRFCRFLSVGKSQLLSRRRLAGRGLQCRQSAASAFAADRRRLQRQRMRRWLLCADLFWHHQRHTLLAAARPSLFHSPGTRLPRSVHLRQFPVVLQRRSVAQFRLFFLHSVPPRGTFASVYLHRFETKKKGIIKI